MPSVYIFEDEDRKPIYIGKTLHPKTRIRQHIKASLDDTQKQSDFVSLTRSIKFYELKSDLEIILLEARLIQLYQPKYNSIQKDDKSSLYIVVTKDQFPEIVTARKLELKRGDAYFGPFTSAYEALNILKLARSIFKFCSKPPDGKKYRPCFYYHIDQCSGACVGKITKLEYRKMIGRVKKFLNGKLLTLLKETKSEIKNLAKKRKFEEAAELKNTYDSILKVMEIKLGVSTFLKSSPFTDKAIRELRNILLPFGIDTSLERIEGYDMSTTNQTNTVGAMVVFWLGEPDLKEYRLFKLKGMEGGDVGAMKEVILRRFKKEEWQKPDLVLLDGGIPQLSTAGRLVPKSVPVISLAKREEIVYIPFKGEYVEVKLSRRSEALKLLQRVRDEAHRFSNKFQKKVRSQN